MRIFFEKSEQRKFLDLIISKLSCVSLRGLLQFGFDVSYSSLKNYYIERRLLPKRFFDDLCYVAKIDIKGLNIKYLSDNWGRIKGGKIRKT